jgi:hypothetical protein
MDKTAIPPENPLLQAAMVAARNLGVTVQPEPKQATGAEGVDAFVRITWGEQQGVYPVEIRRALQPATLGIALQSLQRLGKKAMLVTDYVTPALADELKARRVAFLDTAGNAYIEDGPLLIWVKGQKRPEKTGTAPAAGRAFQPTGLQVLFTLLCNPEAVNRPYRDLGAMAGVAHGTVGSVIPDLQQQGFVRDLDGKRGTRRLFQQERLAAQWVDAYARTLRPRTLLGRYHVKTLEGWQDWPIAEHGAQWGGEPAGALLTDYLRPGELTLYADKMPGLLAARMKFLKEPEPGHTAVVEVRKRFWDFPAEPHHPDLVPPLLVYADLLATGDARCIETAKMIYDDHLVRLFAQS